MKIGELVFSFCYDKYYCSIKFKSNELDKESKLMFESKEIKRIEWSEE